MDTPTVQAGLYLQFQVFSKTGYRLCFFYEQRYGCRSFYSL